MSVDKIDPNMPSEVPVNRLFFRALKTALARLFASDSVFLSEIDDAVRKGLRDDVDRLERSTTGKQTMLTMEKYFKYFSIDPAMQPVVTHWWDDKPEAYRDSYAEEVADRFISEVMEIADDVVELRRVKGKAADSVEIDENLTRSEQAEPGESPWPVGHFTMKNEWHTSYPDGGMTKKEPEKPTHKDDEMVLGLPTADFRELMDRVFGEADKTGFIPCTSVSPGYVVSHDNLEFRRRGDVEEDPSFLQLIPYVLVEYPSAEQPLVLSYTRGGSGGEDRLHGNLSVGFGGHINQSDVGCDPKRAFENGVVREMKEELGIELSDFVMDGMIYDPSNAVGEVHLGVVCRTSSRTMNVKPHEDDIANLKWYGTYKIWRHIKDMETWSALAVSYLFDTRNTSN